MKARLLNKWINGVALLSALAFFGISSGAQAQTVSVPLGTQGWLDYSGVAYYQGYFYKTAPFSAQDKPYVDSCNAAIANNPPPPGYTLFSRQNTPVLGSYQGKIYTNYGPLDAYSVTLACGATYSTGASCVFNGIPYANGSSRKTIVKNWADCLNEVTTYTCQNGSWSAGVVTSSARIPNCILR